MDGDEQGIFQPQGTNRVQKSRGEHRRCKTLCRRCRLIKIASLRLSILRMLLHIRLAGGDDDVREIIPGAPTGVFHKFVHLRRSNVLCNSAAANQGAGHFLFIDKCFALTEAATPSSRTCSPPDLSLLQNLYRQVRPVRHQTVHAQVEHLIHCVAVVDRPGDHLDAELLCLAHVLRVEFAPER